MIPKECKRLAEVDFPIAVVSKHAPMEKSGPQGHLSTLHLWWARRPLAACRAMMMALLLPDPADPHCPADFKVAARLILLHLPMRPTRWETEVKSAEGLRNVLLQFIGDFSDWDNAANPAYLKAARELVKSAHPEETPLIVDPFAGGGSIPLEALRLGCETFANDLNPVACLILKVLLEDIPRRGLELPEELRRVGAKIKVAAETKLADLYPADPDKARPIAYLWARSIRCETPNCGADLPLVRSFWLCKKANRRRAIRYEVVRPARGAPRIEFEVFEPKRESDVLPGTVSRAKATCPCCGVTLAPERARAQLAEQHGGADVQFDDHGHRVGGAQLVAVVTVRQGESGRHYRVACPRDYEAVWKAQQRLTHILDAWERSDRSSPCPRPDEPLPPIGTLGFRVQRYGILRWGQLFTGRQIVSLDVFRICMHDVVGDADPAIREILALVFDRLAMCGMSLTNWNAFAEKMQHTFGRQALPIVWDFCEVVGTQPTPGSWANATELAAEVADAWSFSSPIGQVSANDSRTLPLPDEAAPLVFTDPPYYDSVPYSDLSDFFFVWLKRTLPGHPLLKDSANLGNPLTPKSAEIVQDETKRVNGRAKDKGWFENSMAEAFAEARRVLRDDGIASVVFAHKTTEGWEALLSGLIRGAWTITGSWPIATEGRTRLRARESASLATSVHLVCRPRPDDAPIGDWGDVFRELPRRVAHWMERLQNEGVRGADIVFACIGPALEIYSKFSKVVDAEEREIPLGGDPEAKEPHKRGYLTYVWEVVGRAALNQVLGTAEASARNGAAGALEEDARLTALFLWTLQATASGANDEDDAESDQVESEDEDAEGGAAGKKKKGLSLIYDVARRFAQPLGIHMEAWEGRIIETEKGVVRLLPVLERAEQLFGEDGASAVADRLEKSGSAAAQGLLFPQVEEAPRVRGARRGRADVPDESMRTRREATTLDRIHAGMLLQASGRANALRALVQAEVDRGPDFLRLANALYALYPDGSDEKRLLQAMLLAVPR